MEEAAPPDPEPESGAYDGQRIDRDLADPSLLSLDNDNEGADPEGFWLTLNVLQGLRDAQPHPGLKQQLTDTEEASVRMHGWHIDCPTLVMLTDQGFGGKASEAQSENPASSRCIFTGTHKPFSWKSRTENCRTEFSLGFLRPCY